MDALNEGHKLIMRGEEKMKKILIVTEFFYPDITPRAFRSFELAKEFSRRNYEVTILTKYYDFYYNDIIKKFNFEILFYNHVTNPKENEKNNYTSVALNSIKSKLSYFYEGRNKAVKVNQISSKILQMNKRFTCIISVGLPFFIHEGVALAKKSNKNIANVMIADYGDPYSRNPEMKKAAYFILKEKLILDKFDIVTIPVESSRKYYSGIKKQQDIKIIPQGFDLKSTSLSSYILHDKPTFAYAGIFYNKIRNPSWFF